eukprot:2355993-Rhodomonas_salina.2
MESCAPMRGQGWRVVSRFVRFRVVQNQVVRELKQSPRKQGFSTSDTATTLGGGSLLSCRRMRVEECESRVKR